ncbi:hypothetical protein [Nitratireductor sp.]|uniref:hypothetical protein n=1 Tax=Nitratireductor sp. TaxID=1872084 RepID=UPI0025DFAA9E|nr:hypothetical protein [Nitratireductor sp.]
MGDFLESLKRKHSALDAEIEELKASGEYRWSTENALRAGNEVSWETGEFDSNTENITEIDRDGLLIRTRRESLSGALNSGQALDKICLLEAEIEKLSRRSLALSALIVFLLVVIVLK